VAPELLRIGITCHPTFGGSGAVAVELAEALVDRGHDVHVISYAVPFRLDPKGKVSLHEVAVPAYPLFRYPPYDMALASKLAEVARDHQLQLLHAHYAIPHSMAAYLAREILGDRRMGVVTTLHGTDITLVGADPSYRPATTFALRQSDAVTAVSSYLEGATLARICGQCAIDVIPNFVDPARYRPQPRHAMRRRFARDDELLLLHTSNFRPVKRVGDAVRVFAEVAGRRPARLLLIGDGPERASAEQLVRELGLGRAATFAGGIPDAADLTSQADVFLLPSDGESFGLAALEAMACGVPVVAARAGGIPEVVTDGEDGILAPVGDVASMAGRLLDALADEGHWARMRAKARENAVERFRTELVVPRYEAVYRRVLEQRSR
jgi:N-acetyl-alpha-D-glucosaminyl L-malate synthase BshA